MNTCVQFVKKFIELGTLFCIQEMQSAAIRVLKELLLHYALFAFYLQINMQKINKRMHFPFRISCTRDAYHLKYLGLDSC